MKSYFSLSRRPADGDAPLTYEESLRLDLKLAKWELENAYAGFDYATDPDLIDCYIYKLNAAMKRYRYLLNKYAALRKEALQPEDESAIASELWPEPALQPMAGI